MPDFFRRSLLCIGAAAIAASVSPRVARAAPAGPVVAPPPDPAYPFTVPPLPYAAAANEPYIDAETMELHHDKHHAAYVANLNGVVKEHPQLATLSLAQLLAKLDELPDPVRNAIRNNGGGHAYHSMFWTIMGGGGGEPTGDVAAAITRDFGSFAQLKDSFNKAGAGQFGSGWAVVLVDRDGKLALTSRPNQDSPLLEGKKTLFANDVWEHAYYLKYRNRRPEYLAAWWNVVNWPAIERRYNAARSGTLAL